MRQFVCVYTHRHTHTDYIGLVRALYASVSTCTHASQTHTDACIHTCTYTCSHTHANTHTRTLPPLNPWLRDITQSRCSPILAQIQKLPRLMHQSPIYILEIYDNASRPYRSWLRLPSFLCIAATVLCTFLGLKMCPAIVSVIVLLASAPMLKVSMYWRQACAEAYSCRTAGMMCFNTLPPAGAKVPVTSYTCTQSNYPIQTLSNNHQCNVSSGLLTCETREEPVLICWTVTLEEIVDFRHGMIIPTALWCWNSLRMVCWECEDNVCRWHQYPSSKSISPQCRTPLQQHWQDNVLNC